jgi:hypothetical protein
MRELVQIWLEDHKAEIFVIASLIVALIVWVAL